MSSAGSWERVSFADFMADVEKAKKEGRGGVHHFKTHKRLHWLRCVGCGLLLLRNKATEKARKAGCFG